MSGDSGESFSYKGSVSGLKGFLTSKITQIAEAVVNSDAAPDGSKKIPVSLIFPNPDQPRQVFEPKALEELANTMKEVGQAQAITVRPKQDGFEIISGERRYRAARLAGITHLDCVIKDVNDNEAQLLSLVENLQRQDLLPIEEAHYLKKVLEENEGLSLDKLAKMLGSHKSTLSEKIQLTEIPAEDQKLLYAKGKSFTHRHWRVLSRIKDPMFLKDLLKRALEEQLSVSELEKSLEIAGVPKGRRTPAERSAGPGREWKSPVTLEGEMVTFKNSALNLSTLSLERRQAIAQTLKEIITCLEKPVSANSEIPADSSFQPQL